jgi:hypothetical protein
VQERRFDWPIVDVYQAQVLPRHVAPYPTSNVPLLQPKPRSKAIFARFQTAANTLPCRGGWLENTLSSPWSPCSNERLTAQAEDDSTFNKRQVFR